MKPLNEVIFDVETKSFFDYSGPKDPSKLGVSVVSAYVRELNSELNEVHGSIISFWERDFESMFNVFKKADRIIGFNSLKFDVPALKPYTSIDFTKLPHFDILDEIRKITSHSISLNAIAKETLGRAKIDEGANAVIYWSKGDKKSLKKLKFYCEEDVMITKDIYDYALKNKFLLFKDRWNNPRRVEVDFSYKAVPRENEQSSLF